MGRPAYDDFSVVEETVRTLIQLLKDKEDRFSEAKEIASELKHLRTLAGIIANKIPRIAKLVSSRGFKFAVVAEDGTLRPATKDEAYRLIMGYAKEGGTIVDDIRRANTSEYEEFLEWKKNHKS